MHLTLAKSSACCFGDALQHSTRAVKWFLCLTVAACSVVAVAVAVFAMSLKSLLLFGALCGAGVGVSGDLRAASQPRSGFVVRQRNAVQFESKTVIYMEPSDFNYQGLKKQRDGGTITHKYTGLGLGLGLSITQQQQKPKNNNNTTTTDCIL